MLIRVKCSESPISESEEPDHDDQPVGGAILARLQAGLGAGGVWRGQESPRAGGSHLETRHRPLQQVIIRV